MKKFFTLYTLLASLSAVAQVPQYGSYEIYHEVSNGTYIHSGIVFFDNYPYWDPTTPLTNGWDNCCEAQLIIGNINQPHIYTRVLAGAPEPPNNPRLVVNGLPLLTAAIDVPMGLVVGTPGTNTLKFTRHWTFPAGTSIILEDLKTGTSTNLNTDSIITITTALNDNPDRFIIHINPLSIGVNESVTSSNQLVYHNNAVVVYQAAENSKLTVVDLSGRTVLISSNLENNNLKTDLSALPSGIYIAQYQSPTGISSLKLAR